MTNLKDMQKNIKSQTAAEDNNLENAGFIIKNNEKYVTEVVNKMQQKILANLQTNKKVSEKEHNLFVESLAIVFNENFVKKYLELVDYNKKLDIINYPLFKCSADQIDQIVQQADNKFPFMKMFENCDNIKQDELAKVMLEHYTNADAAIAQMQEFANWLKQQNLTTSLNLKDLARTVKKFETYIKDDQI